MALDELKNDEETVRINDIDLLFDQRAKPYTDEQILDYITSSRGEGFTIAPASGSQCC